jgi:hypothetical protein
MWIIVHVDVLRLALLDSTTQFLPPDVKIKSLAAVQGNQSLFHYPQTGGHALRGNVIPIFYHEDNALAIMRLTLWSSKIRN